MTKRRHTIASRLLAAPLAVGLGFVAAACGDDDDPAAESAANDDDLEARLDGLEVTATGNVEHIIDAQAFRLDKNGLGEKGTAPAENTDPLDADDDYFDDDYDVYGQYEYDYDYYDHDYYTQYDDEIDTFEEQGVVVVTPQEATVKDEQALQVNGTLRRFDETTLENAYDVEFDDDLYESFDSRYVIIADSVKSVPATRSEASGQGGGTGTTTAGTAPSTS